MKATLEFDLSNPDDRERYMRTTQLDAFSCAISTFAGELRRKDKYEEGSMSHAAQLARHEFYEALDFSGVDLSLWGL